MKAKERQMFAEGEAKREYLWHCLASFDSCIQLHLLEDQDLSINLVNEI